MCNTLLRNDVVDLPPSPPTLVNHYPTRLLCAMDPVVNVQTSKQQKISQAKFEKVASRLHKFEKPPYASSFKKSMSKNVCYQGTTPNSTDDGFLKMSNFTLFPTQKLSYGRGKMKL
ncbi:hypothetical protein RF11_02110 [Thelohanellus kitauei]|uniref:Uncharacterized protein n=1 Tax=Thelohanellus kitauei TaxID=669202 RepID=A0A0C2MQ38_THEKT|nr:hypothetical protein RF11_02110 [Thelohanellus kitauei]